jgi:hypothetical protein
MAATAYTPTVSAAAGTVLAAPAAVDAANGNSWVNTNREIIEITNGAGAPITATFTTYGTYDVGSVAYAIADLAVTIVNGTTKVCGPFDRTLFNDPDGLVIVNWSSGTTITARVITLGTA